MLVLLGGDEGQTPEWAGQRCAGKRVTRGNLTTGSEKEKRTRPGLFWHLPIYAVLALPPWLISRYQYINQLTEFLKIYQPALVSWYEQESQRGQVGSVRVILLCCVTRPHLYSYTGGCFLATAPLWDPTSCLSSGLVVPGQEQLDEMGPSARVVASLSPLPTSSPSGAEVG